MPYDYTTGKGTGFTFYSYNAYDLLNAVERAVGMYRNKRRKQIQALLVSKSAYHTYHWYIGVDRKPQVLLEGKLIFHLLVKVCKVYKNIKTVFTIHNIEFQGRYSGFISGDVLGLPEWAREYVEMSGDVNYMKGGIERANKVTTVSQTYSQHG